VTDPPILLLDEITANLDSIIEDKIISLLQKAGKEHMVLSISHRLSSIVARNSRKRRTGSADISASKTYLELNGRYLSICSRHIIMKAQPTCGQDRENHAVFLMSEAKGRNAFSQVCLPLHTHTPA
jgi:ABC-type uncharacterized transport system ATPase subunit